MSPSLQDRYAARAEIAKALAHPSRLYLIDLLRQRELSVNALAEAVGVDQSTISKHLSILKNAGIVRHRKEGTFNLYSLSCDCLDGLFECLENVLRSDVKSRQCRLKRSC